MPTHRHPVLLWSDDAGQVTAALVGDLEEGAAHAGSASEALRQLKDLLEWRLEHEPWGIDPDFADPVLQVVKVEVRPQYQAGQRVLPCPETVWLKIPCVSGRQENGLLVGAVPHLGLRFDFQEPEAFRGLVAHYVKERLNNRTPRQLAGCLPPHDCRLDEIVVREGPARDRRPPPETRPELKVLFTVAEPLLRDARRQRTASAAFGREPLVHQLVTRLTREKASLLLVGEPGVGKSTVLLDAAKRLARQPDPREAEAEDADPADRRALRFWRASAGGFIAGMPYLGEWEERCEEFIRQLTGVDGVLCAINLLEFVQVGGAGAGDSVAAFLLPYLQRNELRMVAEATPAEVEACRRLLPGLLDVFQIVEVPAFSDEEAVGVLARIAQAHATAARIEIDPGVPALVQRLFKRFQPYAAMPGPAAGFLRRLFEQRKGGGSVARIEVLAAFQKLTGLPEVFLRDDLPLALADVEQRLAASVIGQADATEAAARVITTIKAGLNDPGRPYGVLLFCGPTGVGKTQLVRSLAEFCFDAGDTAQRLVRLDMSEYGGWDAVSRFLLSPKGGAAGWIERVRRQPFCVVLFDEIEKAAPEVFDALLGLLDEGRLTDPFGRVTQFRSAIVVMTSNLGASATGRMGFVASDAPDFAGAVAKFFRPEFFNRLDAVVTFNPLTREHVAAIAVKELNELAAREGFAAAGLRLIWSEGLVAEVCRAGYDHRFGARPLQRSIEQLLAVPLARWRVENPAVRDRTLRLELEEGGRVRVVAAE